MPTGMYYFNEVCNVLKEAVPKNSVPDYEIRPVSRLVPLLHGKVILRYTNALEENEDETKELTCLGCCEVGLFTGNEILGICSDIFSRDILCQPGNCIYFSVNQKHFAAVVFVKSYQIIAITESPPFNQPDLKFMFSKLFDGKEAVRSLGCCEQSGNQSGSDKMKEIRSKAEPKFMSFLKSTFQDFSVYPYRRPFFRLLLNLAFRSSQQDAFRSVYPEINDLPFAACVYLAFVTKQTGKLCDLLGESEPEKCANSEEIVQIQAQCILDTAKDLISKSILPNAWELWSENDVKNLAEQVKTVFQISTA